MAFAFPQCVFVARRLRACCVNATVRVRVRGKAGKKNVFWGLLKLLEGS